ncbi:MAG: hypothetical protein L7R66_03820 [Candidatus Thalassarchaeaceae archaeon]|nr:hypothetical protein [Candidatus Thalassarchaeaceae archaeon]|tara:strand:+ start:1481 stop:1891 length:411 start_codon:yes stop_codon:yes gene_type:complete
MIDLRPVFAIPFGLFFCNVGILHFTDTSWFEPIVPSILGSARFWVLISGIAEIVLGLGLIFPASREFSAKLTALFLILIYPANLNMWINDIELGDGASLSPEGHIIRLIAQITMILLNLWIARVTIDDFRYSSILS